MTEPPTARYRFRADLLAGLAVTLVAIPQCLALALVAGLPPVYGLTTAAVPGLVAALAGRSAQVVTGPTNTTGLLVLGALTPLLGANGLLRPEGLPVLATLTLLAGVLRLVAVRFGGATLLRFLPGSVLVGFTAGAGILIGAMQLDEALGLPPVAGSSLLGEAQGIAQAIGSGTSYSPEACLMALAVAASVVAGRAWLSPIPVSLIALVGASLLAGLTTPGSLPLIRDRAVMVSGWPMGAWPDLSPATLEQLFVPACAIVLLGTMELAITARARGARPDMQREMFAQGLGNLVGAFASAFPASASPTRSALLRQEGAQTRLAAAVSALLVIPVVLYGAALVELVPQAALAGVLWATAFRMVDRDAMSRLWRASGSTRLLLVVTLAATLLLPLAWAILFGAGLGLVIHLAQTSAPRLTLLQQSGGRLTRVIGDERSDYLVLEVSGDLHYAAVPPFLTEAERLLADPGRGVVIDLSHAHQVRFGAIVAIERLAEQMEERDSNLWLAGVQPDVAELVVRSGSPLNMMPAETEPGRSARKALIAMAEAKLLRG